MTAETLKSIIAISLAMLCVVGEFYYIITMDESYISNSLKYPLIFIQMYILFIFSVWVFEVHGW